MTVAWNATNPKTKNDVENLNLHNTMLQREHVNNNLHNNATTKHHEEDINSEMQSKKLKIQVCEWTSKKIEKQINTKYKRRVRIHQEAKKW